IEPVPPRRRCRPCRQQIDDRQRERAQVAQVPEVALDARRPWRIGIVLELGVALEPHLVGESAQAPVPSARVTADDGRLDDQRFPLPRRTQRSLDDGGVVGVWWRRCGGWRLGAGGWSVEVGGWVGFLGGHGLFGGRSLIERAPLSEFLVSGRQDELRSVLGFVEARD